MNKVIRTTSGALLTAMFAAGCSSTPPASEVAAADAALNNAGQAVAHASSDPNVAKYASSEMDRANESLSKAKTAWSDKHDLAAATHLAYIAQQRAATAQEVANQRASEQAVQVAANQRDEAVQVATTKIRTQRNAAESMVAQVQPALAGFATGQARLPPNAMPAIDELANALRSNPGQKVVIEGHTDNVGSPGYNQGLAMERAQAVRGALVQRGIATSRITIRSVGEEDPIASNDTSEGRRENRRAQVIITEMGMQMTGSSQGSPATTSGQGEPSGQGGQVDQSGQGNKSGQSNQGGQGDQRSQ